jgi:hypothetical protein
MIMHRSVVCGVVMFMRAMLPVMIVLMSVGVSLMNVGMFVFM